MALISAPAPDPDPVPGGGPLDSAGELETALGAVIAQRLRDYRLLLGLSVTQLAASSGLSKGMLSKIENAQAAPSLGTLARLSAALNVPVTAFFRGLDEERDVFHVQAGQGMELSDRSRGGHRYQLLGTMRGPSKRMEPLLVTLMERAEVFPLLEDSIAGTVDVQNYIDQDMIVVGTPEECLEKIIRYDEAGVDQLLCYVQFGTVPHEKVMRSLELLGTEVIPELEKRGHRVDARAAVTS